MNLIVTSILFVLSMFLVYGHGGQDTVIKKNTEEMTPEELAKHQKEEED